VCQAKRRNEYRCKKRLADPEYAQVICDSRRKWREAHPAYQKNYWLTHPDAAARNRQQQRQRDQKRRIGLLVKNTLVFDVAAAWEKGKVERAIGYVRQNFWPLRLGAWQE
jgi:hypothetical protein